MKQQEDTEVQKMGHYLRRGEERQFEVQGMRAGTEELWSEGYREKIGRKRK